MGNIAEEVFYLTEEDELKGKSEAKAEATPEILTREIPQIPSSEIGSNDYEGQEWLVKGAVSLQEEEEITLPDLTNAVPEPTKWTENSPELPPGGKELNRDQFLENSCMMEQVPQTLSPLGVESNLTSLAQLVANLSESYTTSIFLADNEKEILYLAGAHTLSRDFIEDAKISFGSGLIGWAAENKVRVSVCPFEHDATTLLTYRSDQSLKSFMAFPIMDSSENLLGVIALDSMKSYAFSKNTEKIIADCAKQAATLIELNNRINEIPNSNKVNYSLLDETVEKLRNSKSEKDLLEKASKISDTIIAYDALVVVTSAENGVGAGRYYSASPTSTEHRLLELVCKHKKIICSDRSVHALPADDMKQRSFLSIPIRFMDREAGSLNLLSKPHQAFDASEISAIERIAEVVGCELERIRLKDVAASQTEPAGFLQWSNFQVIAKSEIAKARESNRSLSLLRIHFNNLSEVESAAGISTVLKAEKKVLRLIEQVKRDHTPACSLYNSNILVLIESREVENFIHRLCNQIERISFEDMGLEMTPSGSHLGDILLQGINIIITKTPQDGETLVELSNKSLFLSQKSK